MKAKLSLYTLAWLTSFTAFGGPPSIVQQPQPPAQSVPAGAAASFQVVASGSLPLQYEWFKGASPLPPQTSQLLNIPSAQSSDVGVYRVRVSNAFGQTPLSDPVVLVVESGACAEYEDLPPGGSYTFGQTFPSAGVSCDVGDYPPTSQALALVTVQNLGWAGGAGQEIFVKSAMVYFDSSRELSCLSLRFGQSGGTVRLKLNSVSLEKSSMADMDGQTVGGVFVSVPSSQTQVVQGRLEGHLYLVGPMWSAGVGGQELAIDDVCVGLAPAVAPTCVDFEGLNPNQTYHVGDVFGDADSGVKLTVEDFRPLSGPPVKVGTVTVQPAGGNVAGGTGQEMYILTANLGFDFLGQTWPGVRVFFGQAQGTVNVRVGTDFLVEPDITGLNNQTVGTGGPLVTVTAGAKPGQGVLTLNGPVKGFALGAERGLFVDHVCPYAGGVTLQDGDLNGDGKVDEGDALQALGLALSPNQAPTNVLAAADVSLDGRVTVLDAVLIDRAAVGLAPLPTNAVPSYTNRVPSLVRAVSPAAPVWNGAFDVPVELVSTAGGELGVAFTVSWDPDLLDFQGAMVFDGRVPLRIPPQIKTNEVASGRLSFGMVLPGGTNSLPPGTNQLLTLTFQAVPDAVPTSTAIKFSGDLAVSETVAWSPGGGVAPVVTSYEPAPITIGHQSQPLAQPAVVDSSFGPTVTLPGNSLGQEVSCLAVQTNGQILVGGFFTQVTDKTGTYARNNLVRLNPDGSVDTQFATGADSWVHALAVQPDGMILVGGSFVNFVMPGQPPQNHFRLGRLKPDGTPDSGFNPVAGTVNCLAVQTNGDIIVGGQFQYLDNVWCPNLGRLLPGGALDPLFNPAPFDKVFSLAIQPNNQILVGGVFTKMGWQNGPSRNSLARLNADASGSLDGAFNPGTDGGVHALAVQADGNILVGGWFGHLGGAPHGNIGRVDPGGTPDPTFTAGTDGSVYTLAVQTDGKILLGGQFSHVADKTGSSTRNSLARLNPDGTLDGSFNAGVMGNGPHVSVITVEPSGQVLVGGTFTSLGPTSSGATEPHSLVGRFNNTGPATERFRFHAGSLTWERAGTGPEVWRTTMEYTTDYVNWISLGPGTRVPGGWQWTPPGEPGLLPANAKALRPWGFVPGAGVTEWSLHWRRGHGWVPLPTILTDNVAFGVLPPPHGFGFLVSGLAGQAAVVEASADLIHWAPVATNTISSQGWFRFEDTGWTNAPYRFFHAQPLVP